MTDMIDEVKKIQANLGQNFKALTRVLDTALAEIPEEGQKIANEARGDMQKVIKDIKDGDMDVTNQILKKYANLHR